jgi:hypothetical protein
MRYRRPACAAAVAVAAVLAAAGPAGAHPADCDDTALAKVPTADLADWSGGACGSASTWQAAAADDGARASQPARPQKRGSLRQVGHEPLLDRGMNAAIAVHDGYAYIGSRTDGGHGEPQGGRSTPRQASPRASCASGARRTS